MSIFTEYLKVMRYYSQRRRKNDVIESGRQRNITYAFSREIYIIGIGRSATTILCNIFNSSRDVYMFAEANTHREYFAAKSGVYNEGFLESYLARRHGEVGVLNKGSWVSVPDGVSKNYIAVLDHLKKSYAYVGDKIALNYHSYGDVTDIEIANSFILANPEANYIFTIRIPSENLASLIKMFPESNINNWGYAISESMKMILVNYLRINLSYLLFHEDISPLLVYEIENEFSIDVRFPKKIIGIKSQGSRGMYPKNVSTGQKKWIDDLDECYMRLYERFAGDGVLLKSKKLLNGLPELISRLEKISRAIRDN